MVSTSLLFMLLAGGASVALLASAGDTDAEGEADQEGTEAVSLRDAETVHLTDEADLYIAERDGDAQQSYVIYGGDDVDFIIGGTQDDVLYGGAGPEQFLNEQTQAWSFEGLIGGAGNDSLFGGDDRDYLAGASGDDIVFGGTGHDDLTDRSLSTEQIINRAENGGHNMIDSVVTNAMQDDDIFFAGSGDDYLSSLNGADALYGGAGHDLFYSYDRGGELGADTVFGGSGHDDIYADHGDILYGGSGSDLFGVAPGLNIIDTQDEAFVTIKDFEAYSDLLRIYDDAISLNVGTQFGADAELITEGRADGTMIHVQGMVDGETRSFEMAFVEGVLKSQIDALIHNGDIEFVLN